MTRPAIVIALPPGESDPVSSELLEAGFEVILVEEPAELIAALADPAGRRGDDPRR